MNQLNREIKINEKGFKALLQKIRRFDEFSALFFGAMYIFVLASMLAGYMIWHYYSLGAWSMDGALQVFMKNIRAPWLDSVFRGLTATGETVPVVIITALIVIALVLFKKRKEGILMAVYMLGIWRLNEFLKVLFHRPRPDVSMHLVDIGHYNQANSFSMPSGHSMNLMALVLLTIYLVWIFSRSKKLSAGATVLLLAYGLLTGISRVYLNVHYISDVITGWSISLIWISLAVMLHRLICIRQKGYNI